MRGSELSVLVLLGGCSSAVYDLPSVEVPIIYPPSVSKVLDGAKRGANEVKLVGPVEISSAREAYPLGPGPYLVCIRGANALGMRTYAVFFKNDSYISTRSSVIIDSCETQAFSPLGSGPFLEIAKLPEGYVRPPQ